MEVTPSDVKEEPKADEEPAKADGAGTADAVEVIDVDEVDLDTKPANIVPVAQVAAPQSQLPVSPSMYPGGYTIDVCFEASKLPLDVAIFNSARAAGGDEKIRKYLQAVLVVGGCALVPGMAHALESR